MPFYAHLTGKLTPPSVVKDLERQDISHIAGRVRIHWQNHIKEQFGKFSGVEVGCIVRPQVDPWHSVAWSQEVYVSRARSLFLGEGTKSACNSASCSLSETQALLGSTFGFLSCSIHCYHQSPRWEEGKRGVWKYELVFRHQPGSCILHF